MRRLKVGMAVLVAVGLAAATALALAAVTTRAEYVAAVEPICRANTKANERILKGVRNEVSHNRLKPAAAQFTKAARALKQTLAELRAVPRPPADAARLNKWFTAIGAEAQLFEATAAKLRAGEKGPAERMSILLTAAANKANNQVLGFEFRYCHGEPSKFT